MQDQRSSGMESGTHWLARQANFLILRAASRDLLNPLAPPGRRLVGIREILSLVHDLAVAELHDADGVGRSSLIEDRVFRDPEFTFSENPFDVES